MTSYGLTEVLLHSGGAHMNSQHTPWRPPCGFMRVIQNRSQKKEKICLEQFYVGYQCHHLPPQAYICSAFYSPLMISYFDFRKKLSANYEKGQFILIAT